MLKNLTIHQLTVILTVFLASLNVMTFFAVASSNVDFRPSFFFWLTLTIASLLTSFFVIRYFLQKYVFRKIKLIYKIISDSKRSISKDDKASDIMNQPLETFQDEVMEWATSKEKGIRQLTGMEEYMKNYLGNVSHELKTPLFTVQGYLHTLMDGGIYDETINQKYLERANSNVERLQNIVEDLEIINMLESGGIKLKRTSFNIKKLTEEVFGDLEIMSREHQIDLRHKDGASKSFKVKANREAIRQVLLNLLTNSIKYGKEGGLTKVAYYDMGDIVLIEVSDNGIGIDEVHFKHLFDRFYRVDKSRSRGQGGSGLGLSIVKYILEVHNQTISVRSTPKMGSTFGFTLNKA